MSNLSIDQMRGQPLSSVLSTLTDDFGFLSDEQMGIFIPVCAAIALTPAGRSQYDNICNAIIRDIYPDDEECSHHVMRLAGVEDYELEQLCDHYEGHMEAEEQMGYGAY